MQLTFDCSLGSCCSSPAICVGLVQKNLPIGKCALPPFSSLFDLLPCIKVVSISLLLLQDNWSEGWVDENRISVEIVWVLWVKSPVIEKYRCRLLKTMWHNQFPFRQISMMNQYPFVFKESCNGACKRNAPLNRDSFLCHCSIELLIWLLLFFTFYLQSEKIMFVIIIHTNQSSNRLSVPLLDWRKTDSN